MTDQGLIILRRQPGPAAGLTIVTVDAPGYTQADIVIESRFENTADEQIVLRRILEERRATAIALTTEDI